MLALVQRVREAAVTVDHESVGSIEIGLLVYVGVAKGDESRDVDYVGNKIRHIRIFPDASGKMNLDVVQAAGAVLLVSNFTLVASTNRGRRPGFDRAADPEIAEELYEQLANRIRAEGVGVQTGRFGEKMFVTAVNDGPINLVIDSREDA
ncbi:MAG: D-aminoacyl-tRNA deacylase [Planctomycetota bacterium]|nr:D-aminoacyl-tRNA deacylase [Planctomycetota bacterium]MCZ6816186.1 D-aminoacyl-tRNA deacylase [Planctomycetota bacterium]